MIFKHNYDKNIHSVKQNYILVYKSKTALILQNMKAKYVPIYRGSNCLSCHCSFQHLAIKI